MAIINGTSGPDHEVGTIGSDTIHGLAGDDGLFAGAGNDFVYGDGDNDIIGNDYGNDLLDGGTGTDVVTFNYLNQQDGGLIPNGNIGVKFDLAKTTVQNLGALGMDTIVNFENASGSLAADTIWGTNGINAIGGDEGNDTLLGRGGNDWLMGGYGKDILLGGTGADRLYGTSPGAGNDGLRDTFRFSALGDSGIASVAWDQITGYFGAAAGADRIDLSSIDADPVKAGNQAFKFIGSGAFTSYVGEVRLVDAGNDIRVYVDADTDAATEMIILVRDVDSLGKIDFVL